MKNNQPAVTEGSPAGDDTIGIVWGIRIREGGLEGEEACSLLPSFLLILFLLILT